MKLASFGGGRIGVVVDDRLVDATAASSVSADFWPPVGMIKLIADFDRAKPQLEAFARSGAGTPLASADLECPILWPNKVIAFPANYHAHVEEMKTGTGLISKFKADGQGFFLKSNSSLSGPRDPIVLPNVRGRQIHHECELAVIIGKGGRMISRENAMDHVFGYSCLLDIVVRGQEERVMRKSYDTFCPLGPYIVTRDEVPRFDDIDLLLEVNGEVRQKANTRDLIVDIPDMIRMASSVMTLYPGDIIASGTPSGVGPLKAGDKVKIVISHVGSMTLDVVQSESGGHELWNKPAA
jgi:2-keto-4-pentenoate hydratase/2-oxohepta-3-ene-1,7-dioic acid hydratase in catechol pathway